MRLFIQLLVIFSKLPNQNSFFLYEVRNHDTSVNTGNKSTCMNKFIIVT